MPQPECLRVSDAAVVARFLQIRALIHDHPLERIERHVAQRYAVEPTRRIAPTLVSHVRAGFVRPGEGELWPVAFMTAVDISLALCVELSAERVAGLGTMLNGPQRIRHRGWETWWGWERPLGQVRAGFFDLDAASQEDAIVAWFGEGLEWLAGAGLLRRKA
jgi:hypothetical protein